MEGAENKGKKIKKKKKKEEREAKRKVTELEPLSFLFALAIGNFVLWMTWKDVVNVPFSHHSKE